MQNVSIILALLLVPYLALIPVQVTEPIRARIGILSVFVFTSIGHFVKTEAMSRMLPPWTPMRIPLIYVTGVFELFAGIAVLIPSLSRTTKGGCIGRIAHCRTLSRFIGL